MNESGKLCHILIECSFSEKGGRGLKRLWERFCKKYSSCRLEGINVPKQYYHKSNRDRSWNNIKSLTKYIYRTSSFADDPQRLHTFVMNKMNVFFPILNSHWLRCLKNVSVTSYWIKLDKEQVASHILTLSQYHCFQQIFSNGHFISSLREKQSCFTFISLFFLKHFFYLFFTQNVQHDLNPPWLHWFQEVCLYLSIWQNDPTSHLKFDLVIIL